MKTAYLFDIDILERTGKFYPQFPKLPNHALMKFSSYYKNKGYKVKLVHDKTQIPTNYDKNNIYIGSALVSNRYNRFKKRMKLLEEAGSKFKIEHIQIGTPKDKYPTEEIDKCKCDYSIYDKMLEETDKKLAWYPTNVGLLTRGCYRHCNFCVNRNKNKIERVNNLEDIYVKKGYPIELLDDNLFASDYAEELLIQIGDFYRKESVRMNLRNGLDLRVITPEKVKALKYASVAFSTFHCAWDNVKNSFIFRNIQKIKEEIPNLNLTCYCISGVYIETNEEFRKDILGLFYRFYMLKAEKVIPYVEVLEPDTDYKNPYYEAYKTIKAQYGLMKANGKQNIHRQLPEARKTIVNNIIDLLEEYSYLVELPIKEVLKLPDLNERMKKIAKEIKVKHYDVKL